MSTPNSLNPAPLTGLGDYSYKKVLDDDYSTGKLNLKFKATTSALGTANYKGWQDLKKNQSLQETKFQFPFKNYFFQLATRENEVKVHADFGQVATVSGVSVNLFANAKLKSSNLSSAVVRVGGVTKLNDLITHTRFEFNHAGSQTVDLLHRAQWKKNSWYLSKATEVRLPELGLKRHDFLVGYVQPKYDVFFRHLTLEPHNSRPFLSFRPGRLILDVVYRNNKQTYGAEVEYDVSKGKTTALFAAQTKVNDVDVKARVNVTNLTLGVSAKGKLFNTFNWTLATEVPVNGSTPKGHGIVPVPLGFTLETSL